MLCHFNPTGVCDATVIPNSSLEAVAPSGAFCFHLEGSACSTYRVAARTAAAGVLEKGIRL